MDRLKAYLQYIYPKHLLSWLMLRWTRIRLRPLKELQIRGFVKAFNVSMEDALEPDLDAYPEFNTFFTRALRDEARPVTLTGLASPADGVVAASGPIEAATALQAKGQSYRIEHLLGDAALAARFTDGSYFTVYLSPRDYHRVHSCTNGQLTEIRYLPGALFSVSMATTRYIPNLFARNERAVLTLECDTGPIALVLVGAVCVGSIETVWTGPLMPRTHMKQTFAPPMSVHIGQEIGRFNMGSTVVALLPAGFALDVEPGTTIRMGERVGAFR